MNLKKMRIDFDRAVNEQEDLSRNTDFEQSDYMQLKEENKRCKMNIEELRAQN